ncbi:neprilysin-like isoform X1 [Biomphalaria glabrata]|uniref:Neprilysin-like isoform X1 n=3 Tax=Biomphalaria glabrata TaxID=6526 RepID=A0A9W3A464_BIOGL|nr:neprilysin-like isoform X1 [Biomphalaria glabrata]XP_055882073.1 neprilysin-like isoform X1 [Biomphalaria glabrata]
MADSVEPEPPPPPPPAEVVVTPVPSALPPNAPPPRQSCWEKRSTMEKVLVVFLILLLIVCLAVVAIFLIYYFFSTPPEGQCLTNKCMHLATALESKMDKSVDPCTDFYQYACGGWKNKNTIRPDRKLISLSSVLQDETYGKIKTSLEKRLPGDQLYRQQPSAFYAACMDIDKLNERGDEPFKKLVKSVGKFPSIDPSWQETDYDLEDLLIKLLKLGFNPLISINVARDPDNPNVNRLFISDGNPALVFNYVPDGAKDKKFEEQLVSLLVKLGANKTVAEEDVKDIIELSTKIRKINRVNKMDLLEPTTRVRQLEVKFPWLKWLDVFQGLVGSSGTVYVGPEEVVINTVPAYFEKLGPLLNSTSKRTLANFLMLPTLSFTSALGTEYITILDKYRKEMQGIQPAPRWETCVENTIRIFPESVSRMFVDNNYYNQTKEYVQTLVNDLTLAFTQMLDDNDWMSDETKKATITKLKSLQAKIGYPDYIMDNARLNNRYSFIPVKDTEYMETVVEGTRFAVAENFRKLKESPEKDLWPVYPVSVNAHYDQRNEIVLPAGILQYPIFNPDYSSSQMYGATGSYIARLFAKSLIEFYGSQFNSQGEKNDWWKKEDKERFNNKAACFVQQYGCFKWDRLRSLDGEKTLNENIADNGGLKQSYKAYRNFVKRRGAEELRLPGLQLNHDQVFFLSFAQTLCEKASDEIKPDINESSSSAPSRYRVMGSLQNSAAFSFAFNCKANSRMNPLGKCEVW